MKIAKLTVIAVMAIIPVLISGCSRQVDVASPPCEDLKKNIDPAIRADLEKRCPRSGPDFKPSSGQAW